MKHQTIPPHHNRHCIVPERETIRADEQPFALGKEPDAENKEEVDEVAQVGEEVVVSDLVVFVPSYRHEIPIYPPKNFHPSAKRALFGIFAWYYCGQTYAS